jgi:hypothetical protein
VPAAGALREAFRDLDIEFTVASATAVRNRWKISRELHRSRSAPEVRGMTDTIMPNLFRDTRLALISSEDSIRRTLERHRHWIEKTLNCSFNNAVFLKLDFDLTGIAVDRVCGGEQNPTQNVRLRRLRGLVESFETPPEFTPFVAFDEQDPDAETDLDRILRVAPPLRRVGFVWKDCPMAIKLKGHSLSRCTRERRVR